MNALEVLQAISKGSDKAAISEKQKAWFLRTCKSEKIPSNGPMEYTDYVYFDEFFVNIRNCKRLASGGSYVATRTIPGRYIIEKLYYIEFLNPPCMKQVCHDTDMDHFKREGHPFKILNPKLLIK